MTHCRTLLPFALLVLPGCPDADDAALAGSGGGVGQPFEDDDFPGACRDTEADTDPCDSDGDTDPSTPGAASGSASTGSNDECSESSECDGGVCVADFDSENIARGRMTCRFSCVPELDDTQWCADNDACCGTAECTDRGYCVASDEPAGTTTGDASTTTGG